jgi:hypothetical protein
VCGGACKKKYSIGTVGSRARQFGKLPRLNLDIFYVVALLLCSDHGDDEGVGKDVTEYDDIGQVISMVRMEEFR